MSKRNLYAFIISFALLITVIVLTRLSLNRMRTYSDWVDHTREVITTFESISNNFKSAQVYTPVHDTGSLRNFYEFYKADAERISGELDYLKRVVRDNTEQEQLVKALSDSVSARMPQLMQNNTTQLIQTGSIQTLNSLLNIHEMIRKGISNERLLLAKRSDDLERYSRFNTLLSSAFGIFAILLLLFAFLSNLFLSRRRKWLEGFLESILNNSQSGIVHYKAIREQGKIVDFKLQFINKAIDHLLGVNSADLQGKRLSEFPSYVRETDLMQRYIEVVETGQPAELESFYKRANIESWFLVKLSKLDDGVIASFNDISQLKKYEDELKENIRELERSNTELEQYAYVASHDLQEPLRKIRSFGTYLQDTQGNKLDDKGKQQLEKILSSAERMSVLIKDILSFSSLKKQGTVEMTDLNLIFKAVLQDMDLMISQKKAIVKQEELPVIEAIPLQMTQLFYNLLNNSLKFVSEERMPLIQVKCRKIGEGEKLPSLQKGLDYYEIIFSDNGIGFSEEYSEQIFGLFKRLNDKQFYPGSGIGLALVKKVVDNHHGDIIAKGMENDGAQFYIYLPKRQPGFAQRR
ncbi:MAG TPA: ATP-binding protein [Flavisolibacter sp.]|nr:ATP-binding protein [Flavisolibacter sp.]